MILLVRQSFALVAIVIAACASDLFAPLRRACADEMDQVRSTYPGSPTTVEHFALSDGRRVVIWGLPVQPGPGLSPESMAFIWSADTPQACLVCIPGEPGCIPVSP